MPTSDERADDRRDEETDDTFLAPESLEVEVERSLVQQSGDRKSDQDEAPVTERCRPQRSDTWRSMC